MARFTELARFSNDYVATDMAKVRKFEDGLKLSIRGKIMGLLLHTDLMVKTAMAIGKEVDDARNIRDAGVKDKMKESQPSSSSSRKKQWTPTPQWFQGQGRSYQGQGQGQSSHSGKHFEALKQIWQRTCFHCHQPRHLRRDCPQRQESHNYGTPQSQSSVKRTQTQFVPPYPHYGRGKTISIVGRCTRSYYFTVKLDGSGQGSRSRPGLTSRDFRNLGACLCHYTSG